MTYLGDKRPVTVDLLRRLSLRKLAEALGKGDEYAQITAGIDRQPQRNGRPEKQASFEQLAFLA